MAFVRKTKKGDVTYLELVESYRDGDGKVKQRYLQYLGKEVDGAPVRKVKISSIGVESVKRYGDILCVDKISEDLGLKNLVSKEALVLAYSHLLDRVSVSKLEEWVSQTEIPEVLGVKNVSTKRMFEAFNRLDELEFSVVEEKIYKKFSEYEKDQTTVVVDVTDTYFEGSRGSCARKRRGKDGKYRNLMQVCLAVSLKHGFPVMHKVYEGNVSNVRIFRDMTVELKHRGFNSVIVDRGMHSKDNINRIKDLGMKAILGARKTEEIKKEFLEILKQADIYNKETRCVLKNTTVYTKEFPYQEGKIIMVYNPLLEVHKRENHYSRGGTDEEAKYLGYSCIYHNTEMTERDVVKQYFEKDIVERSFKQIKGVLSLRPVRMWLRSHINGHVRVCYLSYAILSLLGYRIRNLEIRPVEALEKMKTSYKIHLKDNENDNTWSTTVNLEKIQDIILKKVGCNEEKQGKT
jgi:transposase